MYKTQKRIPIQHVLRTFDSITYLKCSSTTETPISFQAHWKENLEAKVKEMPSSRMPLRQPAHHGHCSLTATKLELWLPGMRGTMAMVSHGWPDDKNEDGVQRTGMGDEAHSKWFKQVSKLHWKLQPFSHLHSSSPSCCSLNECPIIFALPPSPFTTTKT